MKRLVKSFDVRHRVVFSLVHDGPAGAFKIYRWDVGAPSVLLVETFAYGADVHAGLARARAFLALRTMAELEKLDKVKLNVVGSQA